MSSAQNTIAALASGAGRAGVAVIRLSGPDAGPALRALCGPNLPPPRKAALRRIHAADGAVIDEALALWFPGPGSFTGEDVAELHVHGGQAVIAAVIDALSALPGVRVARPGEFTRRAFANGKLDLVQAEGLADLVDAETDAQRAQALRQMQGGLSAHIADWRARLVEIMALCEAEIDFPDEDLPGALARSARPAIAALAADLGAFLADGHRGERVRDGYRVAIIGAPNAGKSSLLNALAQREAAIVSDIPGTTRDVVEVRLVLGGYPVWIADTAGLREAADAIEAEGVRRALARAEDADLRIGVIDGLDGKASRAALAALLRDGDLLVQTKVDLNADVSREILPVSTKTLDGVAGVLNAIESRVVQALSREEAAPITRARHRRALEEARESLLRADAIVAQSAELAAEDLRRAARALDELLGRVDVEDILDAVFSRFCIGK
ncbi:MAG: tRNA uridine-5-carboxymethylaminomethyl(34) synthesis GTPase MnmE [Alphaproteobacteria bacterium]|nr:tRNA uridine-5-carboxymethylaminomethyl(34) synthesis GTPase MnmE [Alphaproteobacteria bacterium]